MKKLIYHIIYLALGILLVTLTVAPAMAQIVVDQCDTMEFSVTSRPSIDETHFVWAIYNSSDTPTDVLDPAGALDPVNYFVGENLNTGRTVKVTSLEPGKYYVRIHVWDEIACTDNIEMYLLEVIENKPTVELIGDSLCIDEQPPVVKIIFTGVAPYELYYSYDDGNTILNMNGITEPEIIIPIMDPLPEGETTFWVMEVSDGCTVNTYEESERPNVGVIIYPIPTNSKIYLKE